MERKDQLLIIGVVLILILNIVTLAIVMTSNGQVTGATVHDSDRTSAALMISGEMAESSGLKECCSLPDDNGCYVSQGSSCSACSSACS